MNEESVIATVLVSIVIAGTVLSIIFGGSPDMADGWFCERVHASPKECAAMLGLQTTKTVTTTNSTTEPVTP